MKRSSSPLISVIIATYNASHVLKYAIKSVLDSNYENFELLVIGDCCTDDTEQCVAEFGDERIQFYNLKKNSGQQATPNNFGLEKARGEYIAFLNQDDLYLPNHLSSCLNFIQQTDHQIVISPYVSIQPSSKKDLADGNFGVRLFGSRANGEYTPIAFYIASSWFFEKSVLDAVGAWKTEQMTYETPSQEWLFRAWVKGISIGFLNKITLLVLFTGARKNFYESEKAYEHEFFYNRLQDPKFVSGLFEKAAISAGSDALEIKFFQPAGSIRRALYYPIRRLLIGLRINPQAVKMQILFRRKGGLIKKYRKYTGLEE
ncbi:MAG: glycosyltransferase family 2 protein [Balneolaceae bacterium]|nr:glycosyltransferase family 2 protein [Balneolaceae bacterium]